MILAELRQRLDLANKWVMNKPLSLKTGTYWTRPTRTAISIACRAVWGEGVSVYASDVGHRDMPQWHYDAQQQPRNWFTTIPEGNPSRAAHYIGQELVCNLGQYEVACLRYEQSGPPTLLLASELSFDRTKGQIEADFDKLRRSSAAFRVMVYDLDAMPICNLATRIHCPDTQPGGTYLFAAFRDGGLIYWAHL